MPEGRIIKRKIVDDYRLNNVPVEAECLFYKMMPWMDREARLKAEPKLVNRKYYPLRDYSDEQVGQWLKDLATEKKNGKSLIELYEVEGGCYLWFPGFWGEQSLTWQRYWYPSEAPSVIPAPPCEDPDMKEKLAYIASYLIKHPEKEKPEKVKPVSVEKSEPVPPTITDKVGEGVARNITLYEELNGRPATPNEIEHIKDDTDKYPEGWFEKAVDEARAYGKRSLRYIETILERWHTENVNPFEDTKKSGRKDSTRDPSKFFKGPLGHMVEH